MRDRFYNACLLVLVALLVSSSAAQGWHRLVCGHAEVANLHALQADHAHGASGHDAGDHDAGDHDAGDHDAGDHESEHSHEIDLCGNADLPHACDHSGTPLADPGNCLVCQAQLTRIPALDTTPKLPQALPAWRVLPAADESQQSLRPEAFRCRGPPLV